VPRARRKAVDWAALAELELPELRPAERGDLRPDRHHDELAFDELELADLDLDEASFVDCRFSACSLDDVHLRRARLTTCLLDDVRATALDTSSSTWTTVVLRRSRIAALVGHAVRLDRVTFAGDRLDYVNLRGGTLDRVQFVDCRIGELDLGGATLTQVRFAGCRIDSLVLHGCTLSDVDLRGADLSAVEGIGSLAGATISDVQLGLLAPALAEHLQIRVGPAD
jgi:uncharacterized protein YjbI with pentapeptide repeats